MTDSFDGPPLDSDEDDFWDRISDKGELVAYQDWDSGGPGAGAGRVSVYRFEGKYYASHDAGLDGPFDSKAEAADFVGVYTVNKATAQIWDIDRGVVWPTDDI